MEPPYLHVDGDRFWQIYPESYFDRQPDETHLAGRNRFLPACYRSLATMAGGVSPQY